MNRLPCFKSVATMVIMTVVLTAAWTSTARSAGESLTVTFTTSTAGGQYSPRNIHVVWVKNAAGQFVRTISLWANQRAHSFLEWDTVTTSYNADLDARTGATQNGYREYTVVWNCTTITGAVIPDGTYTLELELTEANSGSPRHRATFTWVKGVSNVWTPPNQDGYSNVRIQYEAGVAKEIELLPVSLDFGGVKTGQNADLTFRIINRETIPLQIDRLEITGIDAVDFMMTDAPAVPFNVPAADDRRLGIVTITVRFSPLHAGLHSAVIGVGNGPYPPVSFVSLFGEGIPPVAAVEVVPSMLDFGAVAVGDYADRTLTIRSTGEAPLDIGSLGIVGLDGVAFSLVPAPPLPLALPALDGSYDVTIRLHPDIDKTSLHAQLAIGSNASDTPVMAVDLAGQSTRDARIQLAPVDGIGGPVCTLELFGADKLLAGFGATFCTVDVSDKDNPSILGSVRLAGNVEDIAVFGNVAYAALGHDGVACLDISNLTSPGVRKTIDTAGYAYEVAADGNLLAVADGPAGVLVYDVAGGPEAPVFLYAHATEGSAVAVDFPSASARVLDEAFGMEVLDMSTNPATVLGRVEGIEFACAAVTGASADYVADRLGSLSVVDGSVVHVARLAGTPNALGASSSRLCAALGNTGLQVFDLAGGPVPAPLGLYNLSGDVRDVEVLGTTAYVANADKGLQVLDISDPFALVTKSTLNRQAASFGVAGGDPTYVAADTRILSADLTSPAAASVIAAAQTSGQPRDVVVQGHYAYVADGPDGLAVIDLSDPASPQQVGASAVANFASHVAVFGPRAAVSDGLAVYVFNVGNPAAPVEIGMWPSPGWTGGLDMEGPYVYVANGGHGLEILNAADASSVVSLVTPGVAYDVEIHNGLALVAAGAAGLVVYEMTSPTTLQEMAVFDTCGIAMGLAAVGDKVCVADTFGVTILDISNPYEPTIHARSNVPVSTWAVAVAGSRVVAADGAGGLAVFGTLAEPRSFAADLDGNGVVDGLDLALLASDWLDAEQWLEPMPADLDNSDTIDLPDLALLLQRWLERQ